MALQDDTILVTASTLSIDEEPTDTGRVRIANPAVGSGIKGPVELLSALSFFREPHTVAEYLSGAGPVVTRDTLASLADSKILLREWDHRLIGLGLVVPAKMPVGRSIESLWRLAAPSSSTGLAVLGAPTEMGANGETGTRFGPEETRRYVELGHPVLSSIASPRHERLLHDLEYHRTISMEQVDVVDIGDVVGRIGESLSDFGGRLQHVTSMVLERGYKPVVLGGDHSITRFVLRALLERHEELGILHFDAHSDLFPLPADVISHANPFVEALRSDKCRALHQIGLRQLLVGGGRKLRDSRISYVSARDVSRCTPEQIFAGLRRDLPYYVTFDIDCMDPIGCPSTGTPVVGGLSYYAVLDLFDWMSNHFELIGADFVEVSRGGRDNATARIAASLVRRFLLGFGQASPLDGHAFERRANAIDATLASIAARNGKSL